MILMGWFIFGIHTTYATCKTGHHELVGTSVAQRLCNELSRNDLGFDSRWRRRL